MDVLPIATTSASLGKPEGGHQIEAILEASAKHGIKGIEICYEHLGELADRQAGNKTQEAVLSAAKTVHQLCDQLKLEIIVLQPFAFYEGLIDRNEHRKAIERMKHWIDVCHTLQTDLIQMPSNFAKTGTTGDMDIIVADMIELADLCGSASPPVKIGYEAVAWGTHIDLWEQSYEVVKKVNRPNFGLCLDTFHIAGRVYGDPSAVDGKTPNSEAEYAASLDLMNTTVDPSKIFMLQLSDAEKLAKPLVRGHELYNEGDNPRMSWSRSARLFPLEEDYGGYLPVLEASKAIVNDVGYRGWISMEIFHANLKTPGKPSVPDEYAQRAVASYNKLSEALNWSGLNAA